MSQARRHIAAIPNAHCQSKKDDNRTHKQGVVGTILHMSHHGLRLFQQRLPLRFGQLHTALINRRYQGASFTSNLSQIRIIRAFRRNDSIPQFNVIANELFHFFAFRFQLRLVHFGNVVVHNGIAQLNVRPISLLIGVHAVRIKEEPAHIQKRSRKLRMRILGRHHIQRIRFNDVLRFRPDCSQMVVGISYDPCHQGHC